jgi:hypothetical protein
LALVILFVVAAVDKTLPLKPYSIIFNLIFLTSVTSTTLIYYMLRYGGKSFDRLKQSIGLGDILLIPFWIVSFSPANFIVLLTASFLLSLVGYAIMYLRTAEKITIPLAGIQSVIMVGCWVLHLFNKFDFQHDLITIF